MRVAKVQASLRICADSPETSLLAYAISTKISCTEISCTEISYIEISCTDPYRDFDQNDL